MRFSHHAKNKMRQYKLTRDDVLEIVVEGHRSGEDENGNLFHIKQVRGTFYLAVVALDDGSVITIYDLRK